MRDNRRTQAAVLVIAALLVVSVAAEFAASSPAPAAKAATPRAEDMLSANSLAVCGCGMVFRPDAKTEYLSYGGKQYACCNHECHEMAMKDPASAAAMADKRMAETIRELNHLKLAVANVIAVTEQGTRALCGCGKEFTIDPATKYLEVDGRSYACCTPACHDMAAKDPAASVKMFEAKLASR